MIPEMVKSELIRKRASGQTWTSLAKWLKQTHGLDLHRTTIQRWHNREVYSELDKSEILDDTEIILRDKKVETLKAEVKLWKKLYGKSIQESAKKELVIDSIHSLTPAFNAIPIITSKERVRGHSRQIVVAPLSDTHVGDNVKGEQIGGLNSYDIDIFNRRLFGWANLLVQLVELRRTFVPIDELVIPMLGDMISGDIHDELARTNIDNCMGQMIRGANLIAQALMMLAPHFETIKVPCVVGNHGRMTRKPPMKDKYMDWDYMLYQWVAAFCREQKNITFDISKSFVSSFKVFDKTVLIMHGDSIVGAGSGQAILKAVAGMRSVFQYKKTTDNNESYIPAEFDSVMMGHFHKVDEYDIGTGEVHICGTMKGVDEFAMQRLHVATRPKQIVTYWHPSHGCVGKETIYLNKYDSKTDMFSDVVPNIWNDIG